MTMTEFESWLEERIRVLGTELEECICARKALLRAQKYGTSAPETERQVSARSMAAKKRERGIKRNLLIFLQGIGRPVFAAEIVSGMARYSGKQIKSTLYQAKQRGQVDKAGDGRWFVPPEELKNVG